MNTIKLLAAVAACSMVLSCQKEEASDSSAPEQPAVTTEEAAVFSATTESPSTKTELSRNGEVYDILWKSGDAISVNGWTLNLQTEDQPDGFGPGFTKGNFKGVYTPAPGGTSPGYKALYPASIASGSTYTLPLEQSYVADNVAAFPMYGESDDRTFSFHNLCGIIRIGLRGDTRSVSTIALADADETPKAMSGRFTIVDNTAVISTSSDGVSLICTTPVALDAEEFTYFYMTVPAATYGKLKIFITASDGYIWTLTAKNAIVVERSMITPINLSSPNFKNEKAQISYTTYNGTKLSVHPAGADASVFGDGLTVLSHTYEGGIGTITLSGDVTKIGNSAFSGQSSIVSITIPETVTSIGNSAFSGCNRMTACNIPASVTSIGGSAFSGCLQYDPGTDALANVTSFGGIAFGGSGLSGDLVIGSGVTTVDNYAFRQTKIASVTFEAKPATLGTEIFQGCGLLKSAVFEGDYSLTNYMFKECRALTDVTFNGDCSSFGSNVFLDCTSLEDVTFNGNCSSIGSYAFKGCIGLSSFTFPAGCATIYSCAFDGCSGLGTITLPNSITSISDGAFTNCTGLTSVTLPTSASFTRIPQSCFNGCTSLTSAPIPANVTVVDNYAFKSCGFTTLPEGWERSGITYRTQVFAYCPIISVTFPDSWTSVPDTFCMYWTSLEEVNFGSGVTSIGGNAFRYCSALSNSSKVVIPAQVNSIGGYCFSQTGLTALPDGVNRSGITLSDHAFANVPLTSVNISNWTSVPNSCFSECTSLSSVTFGEGLASIAQNGFYNCTSLSSISLPSSIASIGNNAFMGSGLTSLPTGLHSGISFGEAVFSKTRMTGVTIPDGITSLSKSMFSGCTLLTTVDLNDVVTLANSSFSGCSTLSSLTADELSDVGGGAFENCRKLVSAHLPKASVIRGNAFIGCVELVSLYAPLATLIYSASFSGCIALTDVDLSSATQIDRLAFQNCTSLVSVALPSVIMMGDQAFYNCNKLENVELGSSITTIDSNCFRGNTSLASLTIRAESVPALTTTLSNYGAFNPTIYVPAALVETYRATSPWSNYSERFEAIP